MFGFGNSDPTPAVAPVETIAPVEGAAPGVAPVVVEEPVGLDKFTKLLHNTQNPDDKTTIKPEEDATPFDPVALLNDPEAVERITAGLDFSGAISAETQEKLTAGSPDAFMAAMQDIGKASYVSALKHSSILSQQAMDERLAAQDKSTGDRISDRLDKHELVRELPELNDPLVAMAVDGFQAKLLAQHPTLQAPQIAAHTKEFIKELSYKMNPETKPKTPEEKDKEAGGVDWLEELGFG